MLAFELGKYANSNKQPDDLHEMVDSSKPVWRSMPWHATTSLALASLYLGPDPMLPCASVCLLGVSRTDKPIVTARASWLSIAVIQCARGDDWCYCGCWGLASSRYCTAVLLERAVYRAD